MILVGLFLALFIVVVIARVTKGGFWNEDFLNISGWFLVLLVICSIFMISIAGESWQDHVKMHVTYDGTIRQYRSAVTMYKDKAVIDVEKAFTDFKYEGYQDNIAMFIHDLRSEVAEYNNLLIRKRMAKRNILINVLTFYDRSLPLITLETDK